MRHRRRDCRAHRSRDRQPQQERRRAGDRVTPSRSSGSSRVALQEDKRAEGRVREDLRPEDAGVTLGVSICEPQMPINSSHCSTQQSSPPHPPSLLLMSPAVHPDARLIYCSESSTLARLADAAPRIWDCCFKWRPSDVASLRSSRRHV